MTTPLAFSFLSYHYHNFSCNFGIVYHVETSYCMSFISYILSCHVFHIISILCLPTYYVISYMYHIIKHITICVVSLNVSYNNIYHIIHITYHSHSISSNASYHNIYHIIHISYHNIYYISKISSNSLGHNIYHKHLTRAEPHGTCHHTTVISNHADRKTTNLAGLSQSFI